MAWMDKGAVNPGMNDDDLMPEAMEQDVYSTTKARQPAYGGQLKEMKPEPIQKKPQEPSGCWPTFCRGVRGIATYTNYFERNKP